MAENWSEMGKQLSSTDDTIILQALQNVASQDNLSQDAVNATIPQCIDHLPSKNIEIRACAMEIIRKQLESEDTELIRYADQLGKKLASNSLLDLKSGKTNSDIHVMLHTNLCTGISVMQARYPKQIVSHFKPISLYLIHCTTHESADIARTGCDYWAKLSMPPVPPKLMDKWLPSILSRLGLLLPALLNRLIFQEDHAQFVEQESEKKQQDSSESNSKWKTCSDLRNFAAMGFENICRIFQTEVLGIFKPLIMKWLESGDWRQVEAMVLAVGAFTEASGIIKEMKDIYSVLLPKLFDLLSHAHPLVRSITCFTLQHFVNFQMKGVKSPLPKIIKNMLLLMKDENREVQEMSLRCLASVLAYAGGNVANHQTKIIDALASMDSNISGKPKSYYFECIGHLFGRMGPTMEIKDVKNLLQPMFLHWDLLDWNGSEKSSEETLVLCQPLCVIATYTKSVFAPYNQPIFDKIVPYLEKLCTGSNGCGDIESDSVTVQVVACLDLMSAIFEGQGTSLKSLVSTYSLVQHLTTMAMNSKFQNAVYQSSLALLGHICKNAYESVCPELDKVITILNKHIDSSSNPIKNNVMWTLSHIADKQPDENEQLNTFAEKLATILMTSQEDHGMVINAALALTTLSRRWPDHVISTIAKEDIFQGVCILLQQQFPRDEEKVEIFTNLCSTVTSSLKKVPKDCWVQFCIAAAVLDCQNEALSQLLRNVLKDVRTLLGNKGWNKLSTLIGSQLAFSLRKRYKLY